MEDVPPDESLVDLLRARRSATGRYVAVAADGGQRELHYSSLYDRALAAAAILAGHSVAAGSEGARSEVVVLALADPLDFITAFCAVALAGGVPAPGPARPSSQPAHRSRLLNIVQASVPRCVVAADDDVAGLEALLAGTGTLVLPVSELLRAEPSVTMPMVPPNPVCYVQYTSGSISRPKPIVLRQEQVCAQLRQAAAAFGERQDSVSVNWVPLFHDMGLVTSVLRPLSSDYTSVILDPFDFVKFPMSWPAALTKWRATHTSAPDFGYALCADKARQPERFDLSSLIVARNAGEVVRPATLARFAEVFAPAGFRYETFKPSYGLAEATLTVTACPLAHGPRVIRFSRANLRLGVVRQAPDEADEADVTALVSCGPALPGTTVSIRQPGSDIPLTAGGLIGEVHIAGPQVAEQTDRTPDSGPGRLTGDIGFLWDGELILLGRSRDRFQIRGQNYYCTEIEDTVTASDGRLRPGRVAAFTVTEADDAPALVVLAEFRQGIEPPSDADRAEIARTVTGALSREFGLAVKSTITVPAGRLPVTTSGKVRREACRTLFEEQYRT